MLLKLRNQAGTTVVEFALVATVLFTVMFALIDMSRLYFNAAALDESTRRGARLAAVCPVNDPVVAERAAFANGDGASTVVGGLGPQHILVQYLDEDGAVLGDPAGAGYGEIRYVRVSIQNFEVQTFIPGMTRVIEFPNFRTTLPSESLGRVDINDIPC